MKRYTEARKKPSTHTYKPPGLVNLVREGSMKRYGQRPLVINPNGRWVLYKDVQAIVKQAKDVQAIVKQAGEVARLLELGDQRLLASDGPCGGQNAAVALSPEESAELYQACKKIAAEGVNNGS